MYSLSLLFVLHLGSGMETNMKIAVAGTGYVGLSIATLLSQYHQVIAIDIVEEKVKLIVENHLFKMNILKNIYLKRN